MRKTVPVLLLVIMVLTGCATIKTEDEKVAGVKTAVFDGGEMDYISFGKGEKTFVILPGLSVHSVMGLSGAVEAAYSVFEDEYTVYLFDRKKNIESGYTIREMASDTAAAMSSLGLSSSAVFGASQGGMIAIYLASGHPELVSELILGSTLSRPNDTFLSVGSEWLKKAEERDEEGLLESFVDAVYSESTLSLYRESLIASNRGITEEEWERFIILASSCLDYNSYDELGKIKCPVLVIGCEGDRVVTAASSREIASALGCEIYIYPSTYGHAVYDEAPDYKERCLGFLKK